MSSLQHEEIAQEMNGQSYEDEPLIYPASTVLRLRVIQIVCGICMAVFSIVAGLSDAGWSLLIGGVAGIITVGAAALSVYRNPVMSLARRSMATPSSAGSTVLALSIINNPSCSAVNAGRKLGYDDSFVKTISSSVEVALWLMACLLCAAVKLCSLYVIVLESMKPTANATITSLSIIQLGLSSVVLITAIMAFYYNFRFL